MKVGSFNVGKSINISSIQNLSYKYKYPFKIVFSYKDYSPKKIIYLGSENCAIKKVKFLNNEKGPANGIIEFSYIDWTINVHDRVDIFYKDQKLYNGLIENIPDVDGGSINLIPLRTKFDNFIFEKEYFGNISVYSILEEVITSKTSFTNIGFNEFLINDTFKTKAKNYLLIAPKYSATDLKTVINNLVKTVDSDAIWGVNENSFLYIDYPEDEISKNLFLSEDPYYTNIKIQEDINIKLTRAIVYRKGDKERKFTNNQYFWDVPKNTWFIGTTYNVKYKTHPERTLLNVSNWKVWEILPNGTSVQLVLNRDYSIFELPTNNWNVQSLGGTNSIFNPANDHKISCDFELLEEPDDVFCGRVCYGHNPPIYNYYNPIKELEFRVGIIEQVIKIPTPVERQTAIEYVYNKINSQKPIKNITIENLDINKYIAMPLKKIQCEKKYIKQILHKICNTYEINQSNCYWEGYNIYLDNTIAIEDNTSIKCRAEYSWDYIQITFGTSINFENQQKLEILLYATEQMTFNILIDNILTASISLYAQKWTIINIPAEDLSFKRIKFTNFNNNPNTPYLHIGKISIYSKWRETFIANIKEVSFNIDNNGIKQNVVLGDYDVSLNDKLQQLEEKINNLQKINDI